MNHFLNNKKAVVILSIIIAVLLWMYVVTDQNPRLFDTIEDVPVDLIGEEVLEEKGLVMVDSQEYRVDIRVYGRRNDIIAINRENIHVEVDVSQLNSQGSHYLPISISGVPEEIEISGKSPEAIEINLDRIVIQDRQVKVNIIGSPAQGRAYMYYDLSPKTVQIEGPENELNDIQDIVANVDISGATADITKNVSLRAINNGGQEVEGIKITPGSVDITVSIETTKTVPISENIVGELPEGYEISSIELEPKEIIIGGNEGKLNTIEHILTDEIHVEERTESFEEEIRLILPSGIKVMNQNQTVTVKVNIKPYEQTTIEKQNINVVNLAEELAIQENIINKPVEITISGKESAINALNEENILPYIDVEGLEKGQHDVSLQLDLPEGTILESIQPSTVTIHIQGQVE